MSSTIIILFGALALHLIMLSLALFGRQQATPRPGTSGAVTAVAGFGLIAIWLVPNAAHDHGLIAGYGALTIVGASIAASIFAKRYWVLARLCDTQSFFFVIEAYYRNPRLARIASGLNSVILVFVTGLVLNLVGMVASAATGLETLGFYIGVAVMVVLAMAWSRIRTRCNVKRVDALHFWLCAVGTLFLGMTVVGTVGGFAGLGTAIDNFVINGANFPLTGGRGGGDFSTFLAMPGVYQDVTNTPGDFAIGSEWTGLMVLTSSVGAISLFVSQWGFVQAANSASTRALSSDHVFRFALVSGGLVMIFGVAFGLGSVIGLDWTVWDVMAGEADESLGIIARLAVCLIGLIVVTLTLTTVFDAFSKNGSEQSSDEGLAISRIVFFAGVAALLAYLPMVQLMDYVAIALALSAQVLPMILGLCWLPWLTRRGVLSGLMVGIGAVILTEFPGPLLQQAFLGEIFWGASPLTMHAAGWGLLANGFVAVVVSAMTQNPDAREHRQYFHEAFARHALIPEEARGLIPIAWIYTASWFLFALGPGAVIGNSIFGAPDQGAGGWNFSIPSIWAWQIFMWIMGVALVWFLATRLGLSRPVEGTVKPLAHLDEDARP